MARHPSAVKAHRSSLKKRANNLRQTITLDRLLRRIRRHSAAGTADQGSTDQAFDKAAKAGMIHWRKAARLKSRLARRPSRQSEGTSERQTTAKPKRAAGRSRTKPHR